MMTLWQPPPHRPSPTGGHHRTAGLRSTGGLSRTGARAHRGALTKGRPSGTYPTGNTIPGRISRGNTHADTPEALIHWGHRPDSGKSVIRGLRPALVTPTHLGGSGPPRGIGHTRGDSSHQGGSAAPVARAPTRRPDDGCSKHLWNVGKLPDSTAQQPRWQSSSTPRLSGLQKLVFTLHLPSLGRLWNYQVVCWFWGAGWEGVRSVVKFVFC
jgi:hypothetical protein